MPKKPSNPSFDGFMIRIQSIIDENGWAVQSVFPVQGQPVKPGFSYTVGLTPRDLPEVLVYGLPPKTATMILNSVARSMTEGTLFVAGRPYAELANMPVWFLDVDDLEPLAVARKLYTDVRAIQMVWPDPAGKYPWEDDFDQEMLAVQPLAGPVTW